VGAGEDPRFIFRRMLILASEDVGMADPQALIFTEAAASAFDRIGLPEGRYHLAHAALYLATAPKSNSCMGFFDALERVSKDNNEDVPSHLKDASRDKKGFGHGEGYLYPHAYKDHWVAQQYLPAGLAGSVFYAPSDQGFELSIKESVERKREAALQAELETDTREIYTWSQENKELARWITRTLEGRSRTLALIRERLFSMIEPKRHDRMLVAGAGCLYLALEAVRRCPEGGVFFVGGTDGEREEASRFGIICPTTVQGAGENVRFESIIGRNIFSSSRGCNVRELSERLAPNGAAAFCETVPSVGQRLSALLRETLEKDLAEAYMRAEEKLYADESIPRLSLKLEAMSGELASAGLDIVTAETETVREERLITGKTVDLWFDDNNPGSYKNLLLRFMAPGDTARIESLLRTAYDGRTVPWILCLAFIHALKPQTSP